jgi:hypothetical protein
LKGISDSALDCILRSLDVPQAFRRSSVRRAYTTQFRTYGMKLPLPMASGGDDYQWSIARLDLIIPYFATVSAFFKLGCECAFNTSGRDLTLVAYLDEYTPGNPLAHDTRRKAWGFYVGILEFGPEYLCHEAAWIPVGVLLTAVSTKVSGGVSSCFKRLLRSWFCGEPSRIHDHGIALELNGKPELIRLRFGRLLADGDALKVVLNLKGANGIKPCVMCRNCLKKDHETCDSDHGFYDIQHDDLGSFSICGNEDFWENTDRLAKEVHELGVGAFKRLEKAMGLNYAPEGILADVELRQHFLPGEAIRYDPMHCIIANGLANNEIYFFLHECKTQCGYSFEAFNAFVKADWKSSGMSRRNRSLLSHFFVSKRETACDRKHGLKASASEILAMYPLLRRFAELLVVPAGRMDAACDSLFALCDLIDGLQDAKRQRHIISAVELARQLNVYLKATKAVWGCDHIVPKHHWSLHLPVQYELDSFLLDCFVLERKHRLMKTYSDQDNNLHGFDFTVLTRAVQEQVRMLEKLQPGIDTPNRNRSLALESLFGPDVRIGTYVTSGSHTYHNDDILFVRGECFLIRACFGGPQCGLVLQSLSLIRKASETTSEFCRTTCVYAATFSTLGSVQCPHYWSYDGDSVLILHPAHVK